MDTWDGESFCSASRGLWDTSPRCWRPGPGQTPPAFPARGDQPPPAVPHCTQAGVTTPPHPVQNEFTGLTQSQRAAGPRQHSWARSHAAGRAARHRARPQPPRCGERGRGAGKGRPAQLCRAALAWHRWCSCCPRCAAGPGSGTGHGPVHVPRQRPFCSQVQDTRKLPFP